MPKVARLAIAFVAAAIAAPSVGAAVLGPDAGACRAGSTRAAMLVRVAGLKDRTGKLRVQAYGGDPARWFEKGNYLSRVDIQPLPAGAGMIEVCVSVPAVGMYAVSIKHDRDPGGGFSTRDGGGFSGNPSMSLIDVMLRHKPSADRVRVAVRGVTRVPVTMRYL